MSNFVHICILLCAYPHPQLKMRLGDIEIVARRAPPDLYGGRSGKLPLPGVSLIKKFEGFYAKAYPDPLTGGIPITIGWGSTTYSDGRRVRMGDYISRSEADKLLLEDLERNYLPELKKIPGWDDMSVRQQGVLLSFAYNLGANFYNDRRFHKIARVLNWRDWSHIGQTLVLYRNPGTRVETGLMIRRKTEAYVFLHKDCD